MMIEVWQAATGILASTVIVAGGAVAVVKHMLRADFVSRAQHEALAKQVIEVKQQLRGLPSEQAFRVLTDRLAAVDKGVAVAQTTIEGVNAGLKRVDHNVGLLLQRMLKADE